MIDPIRVMIVDDSHVMRHILTDILSNMDDIRVTAQAANGEEALRLSGRTPCDVVLLDLDMPLMDGLTAIPLLTTMNDTTRILLLSSLKGDHRLTVQALAAGAVDHLVKPLSQSDIAVFRTHLVDKVRLLGAAARQRGAKRTEPTLHEAPIFLQSHYCAITPSVIAIGASTGGPQALFALLTALYGAVTQPIVITQHMPAHFTALLADHIATHTGWSAVEAAHGMQIRNEHVYVAPGNRHLTFRSDDTGVYAVLKKTPPVNYCRPSVDVMIDSLTTLYGNKVLAVILTGLGSDGRDSCVRLHKKGGHIVAQDKESSVVWGMPYAVAAAGICSAVLPLPALAADIIRRAA